MAMDGTARIVGIGGTTRPGSSTEKALQFALDVCAEEGATVTSFTASQLASLPYYAPERPERTPTAVRLMEEIRAADGIIIASPGYHGGISGLIKNALDYTEDLRDDARPYFTCPRCKRCATWSTPCGAGPPRWERRSTPQRSASARTASRSTRRSGSSSPRWPTRSCRSPPGGERP
jgi:hypothetical protein